MGQAVKTVEVITKDAGKRSWGYFYTRLMYTDPRKPIAKQYVAIFKELEVGATYYATYKNPDYEEELYTFTVLYLRDYKNDVYTYEISCNDEFNDRLTDGWFMRKTYCGGALHFTKLENMNEYKFPIVPTITNITFWDSRSVDSEMGPDKKITWYACCVPELTVGYMYSEAVKDWNIPEALIPNFTVLEDLSEPNEPHVYEIEPNEIFKKMIESTKKSHNVHYGDEMEWFNLGAGYIEKPAEDNTETVDRINNILDKIDEHEEQHSNESEG